MIIGAFQVRVRAIDYDLGWHHVYSILPDCMQLHSTGHRFPETEHTFPVYLNSVPSSGFADGYISARTGWYLKVLGNVLLPHMRPINCRWWVEIRHLASIYLLFNLAMPPTDDEKIVFKKIYLVMPSKYNPTIPVSSIFILIVHHPVDRLVQLYFYTFYSIKGIRKHGDLGHGALDGSQAKAKIASKRYLC